MDTGDAPIMGNLNTISIPTITIPSYDITEPGATELDYDEAVYQSDLQDALKVILSDFIENGGTGLGADVEAAMWDRGRADQELVNEKAYNEVEELIASKGYSIPPGALNGMISRILAEQNRTDAKINFAILIEQARLARAQANHTMTEALTFEGQTKEQFNDVANRTLDFAKSAIKVIIDLYITKIRAYKAKMEAAKLTIEAEKIKIEAAAAANENVVDVYLAEIEGYSARLQAEIGIVEALAKIYGFEIAGYGADARVVALDLDAQIKAYQSRIDQANNQTALTLNEAEITMRAYLKAFGLTSDMANAGGSISAQAVASALSAINVSAGLGDSVSRTARSQMSNADYDVSRTSISNIHRYDED
jgi:hypothetical protein